MDLLVRLAAFLSMFVTMSWWELARPCRSLSQPRRERWPTNLGLTALNSLLVWITVGGVSYAAARFAAAQGMGLLHWLSLPNWATVLVTFLVLDFTVYVQHILFHAVPLLWRLHRVHHADLGVDATTGLRFHPIEIFLSLGLKAAVIILLGATPWMVVAFEALLNASSVFNHGNVAISMRVDRWLRWVLVTPDMHRIHHSRQEMETNSNFGFSVSWWDRLCGTYRAEPALGPDRLEIGLHEYPNPLSLGQLLLLPFRGNAGRYPFAGIRPVHV
jgi:sterol desaturase/sphingolipid hydroxylase (fatty acid hydroxylase superfamily)